MTRPRGQGADAVVLGVLTANPEGDRRLLGPQTISFRGLAREGSRAGVQVVVFKPEGLGDPHEGMRGYVYDRRRRRWVRAAVPWPDIVYNRVAYRSLERRGDVQRVLRRLQRSGVPVFNPGFLDKWNTYRILSADDVTRRHLPRFRRVREVDDVLRALNEWRAVFLKPVGGSLGKGIVYVRKYGDGYIYHACIDDAYRKGRRRDWLGLRRVLLGMLNGREYLVQAAVHRQLLSGSPFDVRVLVQKDTRREWRVSGMVARVAARGRVLTHVPRGGSRCGVVR
ncbi:MAG TPA: YheC/YheD family protein, partial [Bacillota bacterium]